MSTRRRGGRPAGPPRGTGADAGGPGSPGPPGSPPAGALPRLDASHVRVEPPARRRRPVDEVFDQLALEPLPEEPVRPPRRAAAPVPPLMA
ncbi:MAG: hypothetical protein JWN57_1081, partial [Frankiales bacterium]|nr:hypothetical protein [Frankiales bacterium]